MSAAVRSMRTAELVANDADLIERVALGDLDALGHLFDRYEPDLRRYFGRMGASASDADDLVQNVFLELPRAARRFDRALSARGWIFGVATMIVRRHRRSLARLAINLAAWTHVVRAPTPLPDAAAESDETSRRLATALHRMAPKKREVFVLVALEGLSGDEVAKSLGVPLNTVWTRLHHARRELRAALERIEEGRR